MIEDFCDELELDESEGIPTRTVYIKAIDLDEAHILGAAIPSEIKLHPGKKVFSLHAADGTALGIAVDWATAYGAAVRNNFVPVRVH